MSGFNISSNSLDDIFEVAIKGAVIEDDLDIVSDDTKNVSGDNNMVAANTSGGGGESVASEKSGGSSVSGGKNVSGEQVVSAAGSVNDSADSVKVSDSVNSFEAENTSGVSISGETSGGEKTSPKTVTVKSGGENNSDNPTGSSVDSIENNVDSVKSSVGEKDSSNTTGVVEKETNLGTKVFEVKNDAVFSEQGSLSSLSKKPSTNNVAGSKVEDGGKKSTESNGAVVNNNSGVPQNNSGVKNQKKTSGTTTNSSLRRKENFSREDIDRIINLYELFSSESDEEKIVFAATMLTQKKFSNTKNLVFDVLNLQTEQKQNFNTMIEMFSLKDRVERVFVLLDLNKERLEKLAVFVSIFNGTKISGATEKELAKNIEMEVDNFISSKEEKFFDESKEFFVKLKKILS